MTMKSFGVLSLLYVSCLATYDKYDEDYSYIFDFEQESTCGSSIVSYCTDSIPVFVSQYPKMIKVHSEQEEDGGCITLTEIWKDLRNEYLTPIDPITKNISEIYTGTWYLTEDLYIENGVTLTLFGTSRGGDCDELLIKSDHKGVVNLRGNGGSLNLLETKVTSWDETTSGPDTNINDGRSYISCVSDCGIGECSMNISCSEISHLGYNEKGSWGISYYTEGFCSTGVYGNILDTDIHDNYGCDSLGHREGNWSMNTVHNNNYGFVVNNGYKVRIEENHIYDNLKTGIKLLKSTDVKILGNNIKDNNIGLESSKCQNNEFNRNEFSGSVSYDVLMYNGMKNNIVNNRFNIDENNGISYEGRENINNLKEHLERKIKNNKKFKNKMKKKFKNNGIKFEGMKDIKFINNKFKNGVGYIYEKDSKTSFTRNDQFLYVEG